MPMRVTTAQEAGLGEVKVQPLRTPALPMGADPASFGGGRADTAELFARAAGKGAQAADNIVDLQARFAKQQDAVDTDRASVDSQLAAHDVYRGLEETAGQGAPDFPNKVDAAIDELEKSQLEKWKDRPGVVQGLQKSFASIRMRYADKAAEFFDQARQASASTQLKASAEGRKNLIYLDPAQKDALLAEQLATIEASALPPDKKAEAGLAVTQDFNAAFWRRQVMDNPGGAAGLLKSDAALGIDFDTRLQLLGKAEAELDHQRAEKDRALDRALRMEDRAERQAEKALKRRERDTQKRGDDLVRQGAITPEWLAKNRESLDPGDYRYYSDVLRGDKVVTDPDRYADLRQRVENVKSQEELEGVLQEARAGVRGKWLQTGDFDRLINAGESELGGDTEAKMPGWYKAGKEYIGRTTKQSELNPNPASAQLQARTMDDWLDWSKRHPEATEREARDQYRRMGDDATLIDTEQLSISLPRPHYLVGDRAAPDLDATEDATVAAWEAKEISEEERDRQLALIARHREIFLRQQQVGAKP